MTKLALPNNLPLSIDVAGCNGTLGRAYPTTGTRLRGWLTIYEPRPRPDIEERDVGNRSVLSTILC